MFYSLLKKEKPLGHHLELHIRGDRKSKFSFNNNVQHWKEDSLETIFAIMHQLFDFLGAKLPQQITLTLCQSVLAIYVSFSEHLSYTCFNLEV